METEPEPAALNVRSAHGGDAIYEAIITPLNPKAGNRAVKGRGKIRVEGDMATFMIQARGLDKGALHLQHVHGTDTCPTMADDANNDGYVDLLEGVPKYGPIFISLDANLTDEAQNLDTFPTAPNGEIDYRQSVPVADLLAYDAVAGGPLDLEGRHFVIHGVDASTELPETVGTLEGVPAQVTLPVACGEIRKKYR